MWKVNAVKGPPKQTCAASLFTAETLDASQALNRVWRLRFYKKENMVAPAKPLWYAKSQFVLEKGKVVRLV